jgi:ABC-type transport system involved in multi-copper enzyme maturation permease subunit
METISRILGSLRFWPGPVLTVELVTTARRTRYFLLRMLYAVALFLALLLTYLLTVGSSAADTNAIARFTAAFFGTFGVMQLTLVLLIGPALAAGTISQERERRTIEYLYTTPLSNLEIIIGKLGGRVLQVLFLVLSGVPVLALAMLLGGITPLAILWLTAITLSTVLFVTMVSIAVSAWTAKSRDAVLRTYFVFFCLWLLPIPAHALASLVPAFAWLSPLVNQTIVANPLRTFMMICTGEGPSGPVSEPWSLLVELVRNQLLVGAFALLPAALLMRRVHLRESSKAVRGRRWRTPLLRGEIGDNPMYWKELYVASGFSRLGLLGIGLTAIVAVCGVTIYCIYDSLGPATMRDGTFFCGCAIGIATVFSCCGLLLVIVRAAGSITGEQERDCWASLISTPLEPSEIIKAKILGSIWPLRGLVPLLAIVWLPAVLLRPVFCCSIPFTLLTLGVLAAFAAVLGVYCSQCAKNTLRATGAALGIVIPISIFLPCCCSWFGMPFSAPMLLAWPGMASLMFTSVEEPMTLFLLLPMAGYLIGTGCYALAAWLLMSSAIRRFDKRCGRTEKYRLLRLPPSREPPVIGPGQ